MNFELEKKMKLSSSLLRIKNFIFVLEIVLALVLSLPAFAQYKDSAQVNATASYEDRSSSLDVNLLNLDSLPYVFSLSQAENASVGSYDFAAEKIMTEVIPSPAAAGRIVTVSVSGTLTYNGRAYHTTGLVTVESLYCDEANGGFGCDYGNAEQTSGNYHVTGWQYIRATLTGYTTVP
jgi:hypothetical protein